MEKQKLQRLERQKWKEQKPVKEKVKVTFVCDDTDHVGGDLDTARVDNEEQPIHSY